MVCCRVKLKPYCLISTHHDQTRVVCADTPHGSRGSRRGHGGGPRPGTPGAGRFPGRKPGAARRRPRRATPSTGGSGVGERRITIDDVKAKKTLPTPAFQGLRVHNGRGEILTFPDTPTTQGLSLWCFNTVGGEILTFPDTPTTQGLSLWCFNTVALDSARTTPPAVRPPDGGVFSG